jgi:hypothetical protein
MILMPLWHDGNQNLREGFEDVGNYLERGIQKPFSVDRMLGEGSDAKRPEVFEALFPGREKPADHPRDPVKMV